MNKIRILVRAALAAVAVAVLTSIAPAAETPWLTDYDAALKQAQKEKKLVLLDFTGSDWCLPCMVFKKRVLSSPKFQEYASKNLVLVEVDFPQAKAQPPAEKKRAEALREKYNIDAFPTVLVINASGKVLKGFIPDVENVDALIAELQSAGKS